MQIIHLNQESVRIINDWRWRLGSNPTERKSLLNCIILHYSHDVPHVAEDAVQSTTGTTQYQLSAKATAQLNQLFVAVHQRKSGLFNTLDEAVNSLVQLSERDGGRLWPDLLDFLSRR